MVLALGGQREAGLLKLLASHLVNQQVQDSAGDPGPKSKLENDETPDIDLWPLHACATTHRHAHHPMVVHSCKTPHPHAYTCTQNSDCVCFAGPCV